MLALGYLTVRDLLHDRWRSLLTILTLAVVVVGYLLLAALAQAMVSLSRKAPITNNLLIIEADTIDPMDSIVDEGVLQTVREIAPDEIQLAFPIIFRHLTVEGHIMQVRAVDLEDMSASQTLTLVQGRWPDEPREVVASEGAAQLGGWKTGSSVNIYGTDFLVTGLVHNEENAFGSLWMTYSEGQRLFGASRGFQVGYLSVAPSADPDSVRARLLADPRVSGRYSVYVEHAYTDSYNESSSNLVILSGFMVLVALLAVTFGTYNATSLSLAERGLEIRLLNVIGFPLNKLRIFLCARALVLTLSAYSLGWLVSLIFIDHQRLRASVALVFLAIRLTPFSSLLGLGLAIIFALLGVWLASSRLFALNPLTGRE
jgi:MacB-like protein/FtsX-like permease family protein